MHRCCARSGFLRPTTPLATARRPLPFWGQAIVQEGAKAAVVAGMNPMDLKRGIDLVEVVAELRQEDQHLEEVAQVGTIPLTAKLNRQDDRRSDAEGRQ